MSTGLPVTDVFCVPGEEADHVETVSLSKAVQAMNGNGPPVSARHRNGGVRKPSAPAPSRAATRARSISSERFIDPRLRAARVSRVQEAPLSTIEEPTEALRLLEPKKQEALPLVLF